MGKGRPYLLVGLLYTPVLPHCDPIIAILIYFAGTVITWTLRFVIHVLPWCAWRESNPRHKV